LKRIKKSETIEIRLPHADKTAFVRKCREEGVTVSDALRGFITRETARNGSGWMHNKGTYLMSMIATLTVGLSVLALQSAGTSAPALPHPDDVEFGADIHPETNELHFGPHSEPDNNEMYFGPEPHAEGDTARTVSEPDADGNVARIEPDGDLHFDDATGNTEIR